MTSALAVNRQECSYPLPNCTIFGSASPCDGSLKIRKKILEVEAKVAKASRDSGNGGNTIAVRLGAKSTIGTVSSVLQFVATLPATASHSVVLDGITESEKRREPLQVRVLPGVSRLSIQYSTPGASTIITQSSQDDENQCSSGAVNTRDALAQALEKATAQWASQGDAPSLRRALLDVLLRLVVLDE